MKHLSWGRLVSVALLAVAPSACGGGAERPSVDAIVDSFDGADLVADLTTDEVRCFAQEIHDGRLPTATLNKFLSNGDVTQSDIDQFNSSATSAATTCGITYLVG